MFFHVLQKGGILLAEPVNKWIVLFFIKIENLEGMATEIGLSQLGEYIQAMGRGETQGRVLVKLT